jgi:predicted nucleic acid-binding Zn ribbon protein
VRRAGFRPISRALDQVVRHTTPATTLARVQQAWAEVAGPVVAEEADPVSERAGVVTVRCRSAVWAQELELLSGDLVERLNAALGGHSVKGLKLTATGARGGPAGGKVPRP